MILSSSNPASQPGRPALRPALTVRTALAAGAAFLAAVASGCGTSNGGNANHGHAAHPISPIKAIDLAATRRVNSLAAVLQIKTSGLMGTVNATMNAQFRPTTLIDMTLKGLTVPGAAPANIEEIVTTKALYLKYSALATLTKKPWVKITFTQLASKTGVNFGSLLQYAENSNPENQVKLFAISKDIHAVGSQTIDGVATTEYAGTYLPSAAISKLPASLRKLMGPYLRLIGNTPVKFHVWIDAQHLARKAIVDETVLGRSLVVAYTITSVNQPVSVSLPAPSEVARLP